MIRQIKNIRYKRIKNIRRPCRRTYHSGTLAAFTSALFLGLSPVFGKDAINLGLAPLAVVALRTSLAALLLLAVLLIWRRQYLYIYPAGLVGCFLAGAFNGVGSLLYYGALGRIDASLGQLLYSLYPIFLVLVLWFNHQPPSRLTLLRLFLIVPGLYLLTLTDGGQIDLIGALMMLASALLYALHLPINQRVLYDMPAPTVTLYTLVAMSAIVLPAFWLSGASLFPAILVAWPSMLGMTLVMFASRLTLFVGVKHIGGMQTAILGLGELMVALFFSRLWLGERLSLAQWGGAILLSISLGLIALERRYHPTGEQTRNEVTHWGRNG
jgi:drug/metabolite transporter (DMT)-like permease